MPQQLVTGAMMMCSFGVAPSSLIATPMGMPVMANKMPAANIMNHIPIANIPPFGMCTTPSNPMVAAATTAALGVLTPMPCIPVTASPWTPGNPQVMINSMPVINNTSTCNCAWGGVITVTSPGQMTVMD